MEKTIKLIPIQESEAPFSFAILPVESLSIQQRDEDYYLLDQHRCWQPIENELIIKIQQQCFKLQLIEKLNDASIINTTQPRHPYSEKDKPKQAQFFALKKFKKLFQLGGWDAY